MQEARVPLQIWVTQKTNGLLNAEDENDGMLSLFSYCEIYCSVMLACQSSFIVLTLCFSLSVCL